SYIRVAWRRIRRERAYSFINIAGLAAGLACAILILVWAQHELSYDRFHENAGRIGRVLLKPDDADWLTDSGPGPLGPVLQKDYPEVVAASRSFGAPAPLRFGSRVFNGRVLGVDPSFFRIFSFPFVQGGGGEPLADPDSVVLGESMAKKLFGAEDPLGRPVSFEWWGTWHDLRVIGVVADAPSNSSLSFDYLLPFSFVTRSGMSIDDWDVGAYQTYVLIADAASLTDVEGKVAGAVKRARPESRFQLRLQPLTRMHLHDPAGGGPITYVRIVVLIGLFILAIASINFMNLSSARSLHRAREVGLRKVVGSSRGGLIRQFLVESLVFTVLALALALIAVRLLLPWINRVLGASLPLRFTTGQALGLLAVTLLTGFLSGSYPALFLSRFEPLQVLKGSVTKGRSGASLRRLLVVFQFVISIGLIVGTLTVSRQLFFMRHRDLGINTDCVINLELRGDLRNNYRAIKAKLLESPDILAVSATNGSFTKRFATDEADWEGKDPEAKVITAIHAVDFDYAEIFDLEMAEGRYFSRDRPADITTGFVVNETAVRVMGLEEPLGKKLRCPIPYDSGREEWGTIIGVVKDFHFRSLHSRIEPLILAIAPGWFTDTYIRISPANVPRTLAFVDKTLREAAPGFPLEYTFLDEAIGRLYRTEVRIGDMVGSATALAVFLSCLGLIGLASYTAEQRTREIGIRKVLGASATGVMSLLTGEFIKWVLAASLIAWPVSYLMMRSWLRTFAYRIELGWAVFALSGALGGAVALLSVGFQAVRAARANPVDCLRYE
ncbi:MAG TPA: FtsX-like permease family protein, partial [Candidatus Aminicenantes bacterium]|nr:FtsX-like permease family protein [Candidatus Aminicenantes bacterium]